MHFQNGMCTSNHRDEILKRDATARYYSFSSADLPAVGDNPIFVDAVTEEDPGVLLEVGQRDGQVEAVRRVADHAHAQRRRPLCVKSGQANLETGIRRLRCFQVGIDNNH